MFLIFGAGKHVRELGAGEYRTCFRCNNHTQWMVVETCNRVSIFFIPVLSWGKVLTEQCRICRHEVVLGEKEQTSNHAPRDSQTGKRLSSTL